MRRQIAVALKDVMRNRCIAAAGLGLAVILTQAHLRAAPPLPSRNGRPVVAIINRDAISLDEFVAQVNGPSDRGRLLQGVATAKELELLDRLVTVKLIAQEAATMGLDEVPEVRKQVEVTSREILREVLMDRLTRGVKPDPAAVEKVFREAVREWKTTSLIFRDEAAAKQARKEITGGATFANVASRAIGSKKATKDEDGQFHPRSEYLPQIAQVVAPLRVGQVSPVVSIESGFALIKVVEVRYPENAEARAAAREQVLKKQQLAVLSAHEATMRRTYVVEHPEILKSIDYTAAKPGVDALLKDKRVVAEIKGAAPVTVGDLTDYVRMQFFHGSDESKQRKEMNDKKAAALEATISRRLLNMEALKLGIDKTNAYRDRVNGYRDSLVFDRFVKKVIVPENKMTEEEVKRHYNDHLKDYSYPEMLKVRSLAFVKRAAAESALKKLREGADFGWVSANAEGQVPKGTAGVVSFDGRPVTTDSMPGGVQKAVSGAKGGELRLYAGNDGYFYVLSIQQVIARNARPYADVREDIAKTVYTGKIEKGVADYGARLRAHSKVQTFLTRAR
ncbi:MAG TPA: peptidyl-prolyl cis-trans isomerase [Vicinamibacterales bacterium]